MHQQNHIAKTRKNAFDKAIAQLLSELEFARSTITITISIIQTDFDKEQLVSALRGRVRELDEMKQKRG